MKDKYIKKIKSLTKIIGESAPDKWILLGSYVIYIYSLMLNIPDYRLPNDIDILCTKDFFDEMHYMFSDKIKPENDNADKFTVQIPKIGLVDFILGKKKETFKKAYLLKDVCYIINIKHILEHKKKEYEDIILVMSRLDDIKIDLIYLTKLIARNSGVHESDSNLKSIYKNLNNLN